MKCITLLLINPEGRWSEHTLLTCANVPQSYLQDLYTLYTGKSQLQTVQEDQKVESITALYVDDDQLDPSRWLHCIRWSRYREQDPNSRCLEIFIARPKESTFYYALGPRGTLMINRNNVHETLRVHESTIRMLSGHASPFCSNPTIEKVDETGVECQGDGVQSSRQAVHS